MEHQASGSPSPHKPPPAPLILTLIQYQLLMRGKFINPDTPVRIRDESDGIPVGVMPTRWAIQSSELVLSQPTLGSRASPPRSHGDDEIEESGWDDDNNQNTEKGTKRIEDKVMAAEPSAAKTSGVLHNHRMKWSGYEERRLVELRAAGVRYEMISKEHLNREVKSCQLKFDRLKRTSPYREYLARAASLQDDVNEAENEGKGQEKHQVAL